MLDGIAVDSTVRSSSVKLNPIHETTEDGVGKNSNLAGCSAKPQSRPRLTPELQALNRNVALRAVDTVIQEAAFDSHSVWVNISWSPKIYGVGRGVAIPFTGRIKRGQRIVQIEALASFHAAQWSTCEGDGSPIERGNDASLKRVIRSSDAKVRAIPVT